MQRGIHRRAGVQRRQSTLVLGSKSLDKSGNKLEDPRTDLLFFFFFCLFVFLGPHPKHMDVSRLGVQSELQPPAYATAHGNAESLTHRARPGIKPASSWVRQPLSQNGNFPRQILKDLSDLAEFRFCSVGIRRPRVS